MAVPANGRIPSTSATSLQVAQEAIKSRRFSDLADLLDSLELETAAAGRGIPSDWAYTIHLLGHVVVDDLNSARFLWKRIPASAKQNDPELCAAWKIVQCLWNHDHAAVYQALRTYNWSADVQQVIAAVSENYAARILKLLYTAYSTISVWDAAAFLGMTENEVINCEFTTVPEHFPLTQLKFSLRKALLSPDTVQHGWTLDPSAKMLTVSPSSAVVEQKTDASQLQSLTEYVFHLEH